MKIWLRDGRRPKRLACGDGGAKQWQQRPECLAWRGQGSPVASAGRRGGVSKHPAALRHVSPWRLKRGDPSASVGGSCDVEATEGGAWRAVGGGFLWLRADWWLILLSFSAKWWGIRGEQALGAGIEARGSEQRRGHRGGERVKSAVRWLRWIYFSCRDI